MEQTELWETLVFVEQSIIKIDGAVEEETDKIKKSN